MAVIAMKIGSVIGIRLLTKNIPIIPSTSVKIKKQEQISELHGTFQIYLPNFLKCSKHCQQCDDYQHTTFQQILLHLQLLFPHLLTSHTTTELTYRTEWLIDFCHKSQIIYTYFKTITI